MSVTPDLDAPRLTIDYVAGSLERPAESNRQPESRHPRPPHQRRQRVGGYFLLAASSVVWAGAMWLDWQFGGTSSLQMAPWAIAGGFVAGGLGAIRALPDRLPKDEGWVLFRMISAFAAAGAWIFVLQMMWRNMEIEERWLNFFLGYILYSIARDLFHTALLVAVSKAEARREEEIRQAQRARVFAMTAGSPSDPRRV